MSTRSYIGYVKNGSEVNYVYCHWDGYPEHNGKILRDYYNKDNVEALVSCGDMSSLGTSIDSCDHFRDTDGSVGKCCVEDYSPNGIIEYCYLFSFDRNAWLVNGCDCYEGWTWLEDVLGA